MLSSSWDGRPFGHNRHGPKIGGCAPFGGAGSPCNTMWLGPRPTFMPSFILIHTAVWLQWTWTADYTDAGQTCARKFRMCGLLCPFPRGELDSYLTECGQGRGLPPCQVSSWSVQPFGHSAPTSQTDRKRTDSIGQTVLQTVAQKWPEYIISNEYS